MIVDKESETSKKLWRRPTMVAMEDNSGLRERDTDIALDIR
jgi:hypothetical protein